MAKLICNNRRKSNAYFPRKINQLISQSSDKPNVGKAIFGQFLHYINTHDCFGGASGLE